MSDHIGRVFPGGPRGSHARNGIPRARRIPTVAALERNAARRTRGRRRRDRRVRISLGLLLVAAASFAAGATVGSVKRQDDEARAQDERRASAPVSDYMTTEVSRVLLELWKMEDVEALRGARRIR